MSGRAMGSHQSATSITTTWLTPITLIRALGTFDLDPCAFPGWPTARQAICLQDGRDGLSEEWAGRVWLNPPYDNAWAWLDKLATHGQGTALVFARTETRGFVDQVWRRASGLLFLHGRLHFHYPDGSRAPRNAGAPSVLVSYGRDDALRLSLSGLAGQFVPLWKEVHQ